MHLEGFGDVEDDLRKVEGEAKSNLNTQTKPLSLKREQQYVRKFVIVFNNIIFTTYGHPQTEHTRDRAR